MKRYFLSSATGQFARVLHDSVTSEQRYSSSPAMAQHFFTIQKNPGDFLSHDECKPFTHSCSVFDGATSRLGETSNFLRGAPRKRHG
ncbi:hypothetical protein [Bradyrhizobium shewense]|uniref:hypothetical protein n=1 Tax=Bradyrhizobium shewense TaxID=1761772 RepID=UPI0013F609F7|nr:hypothetical protein [Bradyrhizobium shewense]